MRFLPLAFVTILLTTASAALAQSNPFDGLNSRGRSYADPALYAQHSGAGLLRGVPRVLEDGWKPSRRLAPGR
jgi:hypothetical protein